MLWKSPHPDLDIPTGLTTWQWAFESEHSPLLYSKREDLGSYINAVTKERQDFSEVKDKATLLSSALVHEYGLQPGDTVSLFSTNTIWYPVAMWAAVRAGARVNGASPAYNVEEMSYALKTAGSKFMITLPSSLDVALAACKNVGIPKQHVFLLEGQHPEFKSIQDLMEVGKWCDPAEPHRIPAGKTNRDICCFLNFSSGTTGLPKAVMISHHNMIGLVRFCNYPVFMNGDSIMLPSFTMEGMLKAIVDFRVPELILVPPILIRLVRDSMVEKYMPDLRRIVKRWSSGSAPSAPEIIQMLHAKFPDTGFRQGYGATESTACISAHPPSHYDYKYASCGGMLCANTVAKVIDLDDPTRQLGVNQTGEICAKGPQIAMGYLNNPSATAETFDEDGFLHTGDVGHIDEIGMIHIEDRIKEMIKVKGQQVPPAELEDLLLGHPRVEDCAVLGIPDVYAGERPKAYVVAKHGTNATDELGAELLSFVKAKKVRYKWIVEIEFTEMVPKSPTGKLLRRVLKAKDREKGRTKGVTVRDAAERARL